MNPFVNFNKRYVQLPKGCTDLVDVLRAKKCQYCDDVAVATVGWPGDYRWCEACQRDLEDFARQQDYSIVHQPKDDAAVEAYRADFQRGQDEFMRERLRQRKPQ
jgi:hypothetical protein